MQLLYCENRYSSVREEDFSLEEILEVVFGGLLVGFSAAVFVVKLVIVVFGIALWLLSRWVMRKALRNAGVNTSSIFYVPVLGDFHMISCLGQGGRFPFFSFNVAPVVLKVYVVLSAVSTLFFPFLLKLLVGVLGWFCNGAVYTRVWDVADGKAAGESSWWGLASAGFKIILVIKCLLMAFSTNGVKAASKTEGGNFL